MGYLLFLCTVRTGCGRCESILSGGGLGGRRGYGSEDTGHSLSVAAACVRYRTTIAFMMKWLTWLVPSWGYQNLWGDVAPSQERLRPKRRKAFAMNRFRGHAEARCVVQHSSRRRILRRHGLLQSPWH